MSNLEIIFQLADCWCSN